MKIELNDHSANAFITLIVVSGLLLLANSISSCTAREAEAASKRDAEMAKAGLVQKPTSGLRWDKP